MKDVDEIKNKWLEKVRLLEKEKEELLEKVKTKTKFNSLDLNTDIEKISDRD